MARLSGASDGSGLLVLNSGSASFKWSLFDPDGRELDQGSGDAVHDGLEPVLDRVPRPGAVGHRIVHGGARFPLPVRLDSTVREALEALVPFAPLHQGAALRAIDAVGSRWPGVAQVACFDTAFHSTLPEAAARYALPRDWCEKFGLRRFGAHGLSVEWSVRRAAALLGALPARLLVCHLGGGSSFTAVRDGRSIDTTMGLTPLEGPAMGTRSGSLDPGILLYLLREGGLSVAELAEGLQRHSGLLGMSGVSADLRQVCAAADRGDAAASAAIEHLLWTYRRAAGAMCAAMGGTDAVVFTGGIGEHHAFVRSAIATAVGSCVLDAGMNGSMRGDGVISVAASPVRALVIEAREDRVIRDQVLGVLAG